MHDDDKEEEEEEDDDDDDDDDDDNDSWRYFPQGMAKRTVLHLRLDPDKLGGSSQGIVGLAQGSKQYACQVEGQKRREERCSSEYSSLFLKTRDSRTFFMGVVKGKRFENLFYGGWGVCCLPVTTSLFWIVRRSCGHENWV